MNWLLWEVHAFKDMFCHPLGCRYTERNIWELQTQRKMLFYKKNLKFVFLLNFRKKLMYKIFVGWEHGKGTVSLRECGCPGTFEGPAIVSLWISDIFQITPAILVQKSWNVNIDSWYHSHVYKISLLPEWLFGHCGTTVQLQWYCQCETSAKPVLLKPQYLWEGNGAWVLCVP